jgi:hypothetical protein
MKRGRKGALGAGQLPADLKAVTCVSPIHLLPPRSHNSVLFIGRVTSNSNTPATLTTSEHHLTLNPRSRRRPMILTCIVTLLGMRINCSEPSGILCITGTNHLRFIYPGGLKYRSLSDHRRYEDVMFWRKYFICFGVQRNSGIQLVTGHLWRED